MGDPEAWAGHEPGTPPYRRLLLGLFFAGIATFAQLYSPQAVLPQIAGQLGIDAASSALLISAATIGLAVGVIPWSLTADRLGRVRAMSIAVTGATVLALAVPFAPAFGLLLAGRFAEGVLVGGVPAIAVAYLSEEVAARHAARAAGIYVAGTTIGGLAGRLIAGPVADLASTLGLVGWRVGMLTVGMVCAGAAVAFIRLAPPSRTPLAAEGEHPWRRVGTLLAANLRRPRQLALYAQAFLLMGGFVALYNFLGFRLIGAPFDLSPALVSLIFLAYLAGTWSSARAGALAGRRGRRLVLLVSIAIMLCGVLLTLSTVLVVVIAGLVVATAGFFGAHAIASGWTGADATIGRAQASSLYNLAYYGGSSLFGWLGGVFFAGLGWSGTAGMVAGLTVVAAAVATLFLSSARIPVEQHPRR
jgi:predicted MFS family arabinose efflux permease